MCSYLTDQSYRYIYEHSTCRYVRLNALNVLHVYGSCFNAPKFLRFNFVKFFEFLRLTKIGQELTIWEMRRKKKTFNS